MTCCIPRSMYLPPGIILHWQKPLLTFRGISYAGGDTSEKLASAFFSDSLISISQLQGNSLAGYTTKLAPIFWKFTFLGELRDFPKEVNETNKKQGFRRKQVTWNDGRRIFSRLYGDFLGLRKEKREKFSGLEQQETRICFIAMLWAVTWGYKHQGFTEKLLQAEVQNSMKISMYKEFHQNDKIATRPKESLCAGYLVSCVDR